MPYEEPQKKGIWHPSIRVPMMILFYLPIYGAALNLVIFSLWLAVAILLHIAWTLIGPLFETSQWAATFGENYANLGKQIIIFPGALIGAIIFYIVSRLFFFFFPSLQDYFRSEKYFPIL